MVALAKGIRTFSLVRGVRSVASRCVGVIERVLTRRVPTEREVPQTLRVGIATLSLDDTGGHGRSRISVTHHSTELVERLTVSLTLLKDGTGSLYTVEHTYDVHAEPGDVVEVDLDLGEVPIDEPLEGLTTEVRVVASRRINASIPTYVLPDSSTGVCAIEEACALAQDISLRRIDISLSSNLLRNQGSARVMYVIRNDSGVSHSSLSLTTRFYSMSGELLGVESDDFALASRGLTRVTAKVTLRQARGLGATRFEAEITGFEDIGRGLCLRKGAESATPSQDNRPEMWEGEEVQGTYWVDRPS